MTTEGQLLYAFGFDQVYGAAPVVKVNGQDPAPLDP
jgi:hypothetical protein